MPYKITKEKCKKSDGGSGSYRLRYTDKSSKKHSSCHSSKQNAQGSIAAIERSKSTSESSDAENVNLQLEDVSMNMKLNEEENHNQAQTVVRQFIREILLEAKIENYGIPNTVFSDMNEILMASAILGGQSIDDVASTVGSDAADLINQRVRQIKSAVKQEGGSAADARDRINVELMNGSVSANAVLEWAASKGYGRPKQVFWTARPGALENAMLAAGMKSPPTPGHPADIAIVFGKNKILGVSAKATKGSGDIGFKNPGWGSISSALGINMTPNDLIEKELSKIDPALLQMTMSERKSAIRADETYEESAAIAGRRVLQRLRDLILNALMRLDEESLREFVTNYLVDASAGITPQYIKVTATGGGRAAHVHDPLSNPMLNAINASGLKAVPARNDSIILQSTLSPSILQLRIKFESQALASSIKMSAEPASSRQS